MNQNPRLLQTYLLSGIIEGVRIIELSESSIKAFVIPRIRLNDIRAREEINWPALYLLINSGDNQLYIGESEKFYDRVKNHDLKGAAAETVKELKKVASKKNDAARLLKRGSRYDSFIPNSECLCGSRKKSTFCHPELMKLAFAIRYSN